MEFTASWSGEIAKTAWRKREITVDEHDLRRLCLDNSIDYDKLSYREAFELLEAQGNMLLLMELITSFPEQFTEPEYKQQAVAFSSKLTTKAVAIKLKQDA